MPSPYSINIFVPNGLSDDLKVIKQNNWTGIGLEFSRENRNDAFKLDEFRRAGVYILTGYSEDDPDMPVLYIGQSDNLKNRIGLHHRNKDFWGRCLLFVTTNDFLNKAHICWLEWALYHKAAELDNCRLENSQPPKEPSLSTAEKAEMAVFLERMHQIFPLVGIHAFQEKQIIKPKQKSNGISNAEDLIIVPANKEGFEEVFLGRNCWYSIRIASSKLDKTKYIAAYQTRPVTAITHVAEIESFEPYGDNGKYKVNFSGPAKKIPSIPYADAPSGAMQGPRYSSKARLDEAKKLTDLL